MTREEMLNQVKATVCGSREQAHGNPHGTFERIAKAWSAYLNVELTAADVAVMMILFKTARLKGNPKHEDSWVDIAGYAACGAEITEEEREISASWHLNSFNVERINRFEFGELL